MSERADSDVIADGSIEQAREKVARQMSRGRYSNVADNQMKHYEDMVRAVEREFRSVGFVLVPSSHLQTAYALVRKDATDDDGMPIPGRITSAIRSFLDGVLTRAEVEPWDRSDG